MISTSIKEHMFMAGDALNHGIFYSNLSNSWCIENERDGFIKDSVSLPEMMDEMQERTNIPACQWQVADNPYS